MKQTRKPYERPMLTKVKLAPEEAVLANCKWPGSPSGGEFYCDEFGNTICLWLGT